MSDTHSAKLEEKLLAVEEARRASVRDFIAIIFPTVYAEWVKPEPISIDDTRRRRDHVEELTQLVFRIAKLLDDKLQKLPSGDFAQKTQQVYLPMDCPHCGRRRVEWDGRCMKCEKCGASSENEYFSKEQYEIDEKNKRGEGGAQ